MRRYLDLLFEARRAISEVHGTTAVSRETVMEGLEELRLDVITKLVYMRSAMMEPEEAPH